MAPLADIQNNLSLQWDVEKRHESVFTGGKFIYSPKTNRYYALCSDAVVVLDENSNVLHRLEIEEDGCFCFAVDDRKPDKVHIFTSHRSLLLRHWIITDDKKISNEGSWRAHDQLVTDMSIDATGTLLATSSMDKTVKVWDCEGHFCTHNLRGHGNNVTHAMFHPKKLLLVTVAEDFEIRMWDLKTGKVKASFKDHLSTIASISIYDCPHEEKYLLLSAGRDQVVNIYDLDTHKLVKQLPIFEVCQDAVALPILPTCTDKRFTDFIGGYVVATVGDRGTLRIHNPKNGRQIVELKSKHALGGAMRKIVMLKEGNFATIGQDLRICHWDKFTATNHIMGHNDEIIHLQYIPNSRSVVMVTNDETPQVVDLETLRSKTFIGHEKTVLTCAVSPCGKYLVTGSKDHSARVWDVATQRCLAVTTGHTGPVSAVAFLCKDKVKIVTGSQDKTIKVWNVDDATKSDETMEIVNADITKVAHNKDVNALVVAPNNKMIASCGADRVTKIWGTSTNDLDLLGTCEGHRRGVWNAAFSPVDKVLATASGDMTIKLWNLRDFSCLKTFEGHSNSVLKVQFLTNGMQLMSAGGDGVLKLWNIRTTDNVATFEEHDDKVWSFDISPDGTEMVSGGVDAKFLIWKDTSDSVRSDEAAEVAEAAEKDSRIQVLVNSGKIATACTLALELERPHQLRTLIQENAHTALCNHAEDNDEEKKPTNVLNLEQWIRNLSDDNLARILPHIATWLSNARTAHFAIALLRAVLVEIPSSRIYRVEGLNSMVQTCVSYLQRYQARTEGLVQKTFLLDMLLQSSTMAPQFGDEILTKKEAEKKSLDATMSVLLGDEWAEVGSDEPPSKKMKTN